MRTCTKCGQSKPIENFRFIRLNKDGTELRKAQCEDCYNEHYREKHRRKSVEARKSIYQQRKQKTTFESRKDYRLKYRFGLTLQQYEQMLVSQDNKCYICQSVFDEKNSPKVDHDHVTGKVRKLLCMSCNTSLGHLQEDPELFNKCIQYLQEHNDNLQNN